MNVLKFFGSGFLEDRPRYRFYLIYSIFWFVIASAVFSWFIANDKSLIWRADGWEQHYKALVYYGHYLREIAGNLLYNHQLIIPQYDFNISEGADILHTLNYYVIGDPLALSSVFVPEKYTHILYSVLNVLRMYFAGITFCVMSYGLGQKNRFGIFAGAVSYSFCMWALLNAERHPYFLNPMIYMPLIILGIEKVLRKERPYLLIISMAVAAASNFYFFQMIIIISAVYTIIRCIILYNKKIKRTVINILKVSGMMAIGIGIAGVILLPVIYVFINDDRSAINHPFHLFYPLSYYSSLPGIFLSTVSDRWLFIGLTPAALLSCFLLFSERKKYLFVKIIFIICFLIILFPIGGRLFNGMGYEANRWSWAFPLLCSFILVLKWDKVTGLKTREAIYLFVCGTGVLLTCVFFDYSRTAQSFSTLAVLFVTLFVAAERNVLNKNAKQILICFLTAGGIILSAFWLYAPKGGNYLSEANENEKIALGDCADEIKELMYNAGGSIQRYTGKSIKPNVSMINNVSSTNYFWTLSNPFMGYFRRNMEINCSLLNSYEGYDARTALLTVSAVDYFIAPENNADGIPYGFEQTGTAVINQETKDRHINELKAEKGTDSLSGKQKEKIEESDTVINIYKNSFFLPIAYCYDSFIETDQWEKMDAVQKQQAQLTGVYLGEDSDNVGLLSSGGVTDYKKLPFSVDAGKEVTYKDGCFIITKDNATVKINMETEDDSETYIELKGLDFTPVKTYDLYFGKDDIDPEALYNPVDWKYLTKDEQIKIRDEKKYWDLKNKSGVTIYFKSENGERECKYRTRDDNFYMGVHDFIVNMGYAEKPADSVEIVFPYKGVYTLSDLNVYAATFTDYEKNIQKLKKSAPESIKYDTDKMSIYVSAEKDELMCVAVPYLPGWSATVDGTSEKVYLANERYLGVMLSKGEHKVEFVYNRPYTKAGIAVTIAGAAALSMVCVITEIVCKRRKRVRL